MISFTFLPRTDDPSWDADDLSGAPARTLTADDLTFHYFSSDVVINDGLNEIQLRTPGLPVIDFILMLVQMRREVALFGESAVESSQTQDSITAVRTEDSVELSYSFSSAISKISLHDLKEAPRGALESAFKVLFSANGDLRFNRYLIELADLVQSG
ncbi:MULTISPECIES: hypothetical protein [unclassified Streptomyces]|nr:MULTISPECIES: hypothetical protein [unclassified Streptomyces]QNE27246.1 hypothetical protein F1D59_22865 [Streptomyces sp. INR7]